MIENILKKYEKVKVGKQEIELWKLKDRIRNGEDKLDIDHRNLDTMTNDQLREYFLELVDKWKQKEKDVTAQTGKLPEATTPDTASEVTIAQLPMDIQHKLYSVADHYDVEPEAIYDEYLDLKERIDKPYPLSDFKRILEGANDSLTFETFFIRASSKINYTDKLTYDKLLLYKLTINNSKDDIIRECRKAEIILYKLGTLSEDSVGVTQLETRSKDTLLDYFERLYYRIDERLAIKGNYS